MTKVPLVGVSAEFTALSGDQREILLAHYKRCDEMWRHWTPTIWSVPSVAAAINVGAYAFLFDDTKHILTGARILSLAILVVLNLALTVGVWKHRGLQKTFGGRLVAIERFAGISVVEFEPLQKQLSASALYVTASAVMLLSSGGLFVREVLCWLHRAA